MKNKILILISLILVSGIISDYLINSDQLFINTYTDVLTREQIKESLGLQQKWKWLGYILSPILVLIRAFLVAVCLNVGMFFYDMENKLKLNFFFKIALSGEFVLVLVVFFKLLYFLFIKTEYTLQDIHQYYPFSYINFLNIENIEPWLIYPLQTINLFEVVYFFVLVYGLHKLLKNKYWKSFEIVVVSYGTGLVIWLGLVMFLTLNIT